VGGAAPQANRTTVEGGVRIASLAIGHRYRQDDWASIAAAPDGSLWLAWLSFNGQRDDLAIRHFLKTFDTTFGMVLQFQFKHFEGRVDCFF